MKKVLLPQKIHEDGLSVLQGQVEVIIAPDPSQDTVSRYIQDADAVILRTTSTITRTMIQSAPNLQVISRTGVGVDNVDVRAATERGVIVCNLPAFNNVSVAEHTVALILSLAKAIIFLDGETREANWSSRNCQKMVQLKGKTLGVIGFGAIGSSVAGIMRNGFGMKVLAYDPYLEKSRGQTEACIFGSLEQLMSQSDVLSVHLPAAPETVGLLDERLLGMRSGIPLVMGGGDTACATYGAGGLGEGEILNISGSNEILTVTMKRPFAGKRHNLRTHVIKDRWIAFVITVSGIALEWFRTQFCLDMSEKIFYQDFLPAALADASTFDVRYAPYLSGDRYSMVQRRGAFTGLTLNTTRKKILRSMVDGNTQQMYKLLSKLEEQITLQNKISLTGGATGGAITEYKARTWFKGYQLVEKEDCTLKGLFKLTSKSR